MALPYFRTIFVVCVCCVRACVCVYSLLVCAAEIFFVPKSRGEENRASNNQNKIGQGEERKQQEGREEMIRKENQQTMAVSRWLAEGLTS